MKQQDLIIEKQQVALKHQGLAMESQENKMLKYCIFCGKQIDQRASICPFCGSDLVQEQVITQSHQQHAQTQLHPHSQQQVLPPILFQQIRKKTTVGKVFAWIGSQIIYLVAFSFMMGFLI